MEEGKDKIAISCEDILTLSQAMSGQEVKYARLEMRHEMVLEENERLKKRLEESEAARVEAEAKAKYYQEESERQRIVADQANAKLSELLNNSQQTERVQLEKAIALLLEKNTLLSLLKMKAFMRDHVPDLPTAMTLRGFVEECMADDLNSTILGVVRQVMLLPEIPKPQPPMNIDNHYVTMTGSEAIYNEHPKE